MGLTATNALVAIAVGAGAPVNQPNGNVLVTASGSALTFSLQSTTLIQAWTINIASDNTSLNGIVLQWDAGQQNKLTLPVPSAPYVINYTSLVSDGTSSTASATGQVQATSNLSASLSGDVTGPSNSNVVTGANVPPGITRVIYRQTQATGTPSAVTAFSSQDAHTGSGVSGGDMSFILGADDGSPGNPRIFYFGMATAPGGHEPATNYFGLMTVKHLPSGGVGLNLGGGTDNIGTGVNGIEISSATTIGIATEVNPAGGPSDITYNPCNAAGAHSQFNMKCDPGTALPAITMGIFEGAVGASTGFLRLPWGNSSGSQEVIDQRNSGNTADLSIISRQSSILSFGNLNENAALNSSDTLTLQIANNTGKGAKLLGPHGSIATFATDNFATWTQNDVWPITHDANGWQIYSGDTTSTSAGQTLVQPIPISSGTQAVTGLTAILIGRAPGTGDFARLKIEWTYCNNSGTIAAPTGSQPAWTDVGHTAGAGTSIGPQFAISASTIIVTGTPWTASAVHWTLHVQHTVNMGAPVGPSTPPGSPVLWLRADLQALGTVTSWSDQSGNGHNATVPGGATAPVNTASSGPGGTLPAVLFHGLSAWYALSIANALIGVDNYTIAVVARVTATATQQVFVQSGDTTSGVTLGVGLDNTASREASTPNSISLNAIVDGAATTSWESWIFTSDVSGNLSLMVNGAPQSISPSTSIATSPSAHFYLGSWVPSTGRLDGALFEVLIYSTAQSNSAVYAYVHTITGL